jgi:hypothetical protein
MPPNPTRAPVRRTSRRFSTAHIPLPVYLGIDMEIRNNNTSYYSISVHDGMYSTDYYAGELVKHDPSISSSKEMMLEAFAKLQDIVHTYSVAENYKVQLIACSYDIAAEFMAENDYTVKFEEISTMSDYWFQLDALPFLVETHAGASDERASAAVRKAVMWYVCYEYLSVHQNNNLYDALILTLLQLGLAQSILEIFLVFQLVSVMR